MSRLVVVALLVAAVASGCLGNKNRPHTGDEVEGTTVVLRPEGGFRYDQPVIIFLIGFEAGTGKVLSDTLSPEEVHHGVGSFVRAFPPEPNDPEIPLSQPISDNPVIPTAHYDVIELDARFAQAFIDNSSLVAGEEGIYDARATEAWLVGHLAASGHALDPTIPAAAIVHAGELGTHAWRQTFNAGYLQPVRAFGEKEARLTIFDASAEPDPYVTGESLQVGATGTNALANAKPYDQPIPAGGQQTIAALRDLVIDLTHYRFLKGPQYPIATTACHQVTMVLAVQSASLQGTVMSVQDMVDVTALESAYENVTGEDILVDMKFLTLPQDDPVLDGLARGASTFATLDALRWYLDENFDTFVDAKEGCEEYLSILVIGDAGQHAIAFNGLGTYDVKRSHRIAFSMVTDRDWITDENGPSAIGGGNPSRTRNQVDFFFAHETAHILGLLHTQVVVWSNGTGVEHSSFESVWSAMSYESGDRLQDFGLMDQANWQRNRAGFAVKQAQVLGLADTLEFKLAVASFEEYDWNAGFDALLPLLTSR